jgi:hypothetical protein
MNKWDVRVALSKMLTGVLLIPWLICYYGGKALTRTSKGIESVNGKVRKWANPDLYGKAPLRARKLFYRRRTVERLCEKIELLEKQARQRQDES